MSRPASGHRLFDVRQFLQIEGVHVTIPSNGSSLHKQVTQPVLKTEMGATTIPAATQFRVAAAGTILLAIFLAFADIGGLPLEDHEIYVVKTTQEMHDRGDWIVPYFDQTPRLTKPPLNYWLSGLAAWGTTRPYSVGPWQGRAPSAAAGVVLVWCTLQLGAMVGGPWCGVLAALASTTSYGFLIYSHNARPEMVYAAANAFSILSFFKARERVRSSPEGRNPWAYGIWAGFGIATLAKGPHLPLLLLGGMLVGWWWSHEPRALLRRAVTPVRGLAIAASIALPWWLLLYLRLSGTDAGALGNSQLSGTLYAFDWVGALIPKYLFVTPQLVLPWIVLFPALVLLPRNLTAERKVLACLVIIPAVILNVAEKRHSYYLLPILMPLVVLLVDLSLSAVDRHPERLRGVLRWLAPIHGVAAVVALAWIFAVRGWNYPGPQFLNLTVAGILVVTLVASIQYRTSLAKRPVVVGAAIGILFAAASAGILLNGYLVSASRYADARLARDAGRYLNDSTPLLVFDFSGIVPVYYTDRSPIACYTVEDVARAIAKSPDGTSICLGSDRAYEAMSDALDVEVLETSTEKNADRRYLLRVKHDPNKPDPLKSSEGVS